MIRQLAYLIQSLLTFVVFAGFNQLQLSIWVTLPMLVLLNFIVILVHELGHAAAVIRVGGTLRAIYVMGIHFDVAERRLSLRRLPKKAEIGGYVSYAPHPVQHSSKKAILIALAGPAANILLALIAGLAALLLLPDPASCIRAYDPVLAADPGYARLPDSDVVRRVMAEVTRADACVRAGTFLRRFAEVLAILSAGIGLSNLLPFDGSDGQAVLSHARARRRRR